MGDMKCVVAAKTDIDVGRTSYFIYILLGVGGGLSRECIGSYAFYHFYRFGMYLCDFDGKSCTPRAHTTIRTLNRCVETARDASVCGGKIMLYDCRNMLFISIRWRFVFGESSIRFLPEYIELLRMVYLVISAEVILSFFYWSRPYRMRN